MVWANPGPAISQQKAAISRSFIKMGGPGFVRGWAKLANRMES
jgi:hypothetical protein